MSGFDSPLAADPDDDAEDVFSLLADETLPSPSTRDSKYTA
ncbi:hypothetical protein [Haloferax sp. Atlit-12N]|nr:hypothetical protein [Haloferax sp. Atlit-12N]